MVTMAPERTRPLVRSVPPGDYPSRGVEVIELAERAGLTLDGWQQDVIVDACRVKPDGRWAAFEVGVDVARQNGKGGILEARELGGLFLFGSKLSIHSSHQFDTSMEAFSRLLGLIENTDELRERVKRVTRSHGEEGITLKSGERIRFRTRTKGGGRGFTVDDLYLDEAMFIPEFFHGALLPTLSARPNPQVFYTGSAVDQEVHEHGVVFARVRERGHAEENRSLVYFEFGLPLSHPAELTDAMAEDPELWRQSNPALGIRISPEHVSYEQTSMSPRTFAVERMNVGDWPRTDGETASVIKLEDWDGLRDERSVLLDPVCLAFDVSPERQASISAAGRNEDGRWHVEVLEQRSGTGWLAARLLELYEQHDPLVVVCDGYGPASSLVGAVHEAGVDVVAVSATEHAQACGLFVDAVNERTLRHLGSLELRAAIRGAATRPLTDAWAWSRRASSVNISPLVSVTLALWAAINRPDVDGEMVIW